MFAYPYVRVYNKVPMKNYKITVVLPVYNGSNYLNFALDCVKNQTYQNLEVLIINDGSKDEGKTEAIAKSYLSDPRFKYIEKPNTGVSDTLNTGIKMATGDFFVWLSHDDGFTYDSLERRLNKWVKQGEKENIVISTSTKFIDKDGKKIRRISARSKDLNNIYDVYSSLTNGCSLLIPMSLIKGHEFRTDMKFMQDYYLWCTFISKGASFKNINKKITYSRVHGEQVTLKGREAYEHDFAIFSKDFIEPLFGQKEYRQIKKITYMMQKKIYIWPLFESYIKEYVSRLKKEKKWCVYSSIHLSIDKCIAKVIKMLRG